MSHPWLSAFCITAVAGLTLAAPGVAHAADGPGTYGTTGNRSGFTLERSSSPVVVTGNKIPAWSRLAATGVAATYPSGAATTGDARRTAHNGTIVVPPDARTGVDPDSVAAYRWDGTGYVEIPVQVDQRFPYFLANGRSSFSTYSGTDMELTYAWDSGPHATGEEAWKKVFGACDARLGTPAEIAASPLFTPGPQETAASWAAAMADPVPTFDDDDELVFQAGDAGAAAPAAAKTPAGTSDGQDVLVTDPTTGTAQHVYLYLRVGGSSFGASNGYVQQTRDADADRWIDKNSFPSGSTEALGISNGGYGPNLPGPVCNADGSTRASTDRFPRDGVTFTTPTYLVHATGRWMVRELRIAAFGMDGAYGPDLIDRWKGRAFQQSPDSAVSLVGFEDEQVNWEANAGLLGWRSGPVRAIREVWGADSGTNVTKIERYYRNADAYEYHLRVHPIPADGLYTDWDYNPSTVSTYYNTIKTDGVPIDGVNDDMLNTDEVAGMPAFTDDPDPTFSPASAILTPEEVAGRNGNGLAVYTFELTGATSAANATVVPYYRDDACLDDGTGDSPVPRPWPGEASDSTRGMPPQAFVHDAYVAYWKSQGAPASLTYADLKCQPAAPAGTPPWQVEPFQGAIGQHGVHFATTGDSDNAFGPVPLTEVVGQQWRYSVPSTTPQNVSAAYGRNVQVPLQAVVVPSTQAAGDPVLPEAPLAVLIPLAGLAAATVVLRPRRRTA